MSTPIVLMSPAIRTWSGFHGTINAGGETAMVTGEPFASECRA